MTMESMTGLPSGKRGRRGRRGAGKGNPPHPHVHLANAKTAHAKGDFAGAKRHAFSFIKTLPSQSTNPDAAFESDEPAKAYGDEEFTEKPTPQANSLKANGNVLSVAEDKPFAPDPGFKAGASGASKLAAMLRARKNAL